MQITMIWGYAGTADLKDTQGNDHLNREGGGVGGRGAIMMDGLIDYNWRMDEVRARKNRLKSLQNIKKKKNRKRKKKGGKIWRGWPCQIGMFIPPSLPVLLLPSPIPQLLVTYIRTWLPVYI